MSKEEALEETCRKLTEQVETLKELVQKYESAALYPGSDQRHVGSSVATQLVYALQKKDEFEAQLQNANEKNKQLYSALLLEPDISIDDAVSYIKHLLDKVPVGRTFQERVSWNMNIKLSSTEDEIIDALNTNLGRLKYLEAILEENKDVEDWCINKGWERNCTPEQFINGLWESLNEDIESLNELLTTKQDRIQTLEDMLNMMSTTPEWIAKAREAGVTYNGVRDVVQLYLAEEISVGRMIEMLREIAYGAAMKISIEKKN